MHPFLPSERFSDERVKGCTRNKWVKMWYFLSTLSNIVCLNYIVFVQTLCYLKIVSSHTYLFHRAIYGNIQAHIEMQKQRHTGGTLRVSGMQYYHFVQSVNTCSKSVIEVCSSIRINTTIVCLTKTMADQKCI